MDRADRDRLIVEHWPMVARLVGLMCLGKPSSVDRDEALGSAALVLCTAAERFDPTKGTTFAQYVTLRVRGAVRDSWRRAQWNQRGRDRQRTVETLEGAADRVAGEPSFEDPLVDRWMLLELVAELPARSRHIIEASFFDGRSIRDIAPELGVSESRVSQIRSAALARMRSRLAS